MALRDTWRLTFPRLTVANAAAAKAAPLRKEVLHKRARLEQYEEEFSRVGATSETYLYKSEDVQNAWRDRDVLRNDLRNKDTELRDLEFWVRILTTYEGTIDLDMDDIGYFEL